MGFNTEDFENLCPRSLYFAFLAHADQRERQEAFELEKMRLQTMYLINIQLSKANQITNPRDFMPFEHEIKEIEETAPVEITPEQWQALQDQADKLLKKGPNE